MKEHRLKGIIEDKNRLFTINLVKGKTVYDENLIRKGGKEFRSWNPEKSKLAAAILNGLNLEIKED